MYYYIFESPKSPGERAFFERIQQIAREFGIFGEFVQASPARSAQELVEIAVMKNYSTIVAIGGDTHVNKVASKIINLGMGSNIVLGIISTEEDSFLAERWWFKKPEEAMETIKFRKLTKFDIGLIEPNHYFLTNASIICKKPSRIVLEVDRWQAEAVVDRVDVSSNLYILMERYARESSIVKSTFNWLMGRENIRYDQSLFKGKVVRITSSDPLPVYVGKEVMTHTPINVYRKLNALNIITKRDKVSDEIKNEVEE